MEFSLAIYLSCVATALAWDVAVCVQEKHCTGILGDLRWETRCMLLGSDAFGGDESVLASPCPQQGVEITWSEKQGSHVSGGTW